MTDFVPRPVRLTSVRESGFADGRHEVSPDSERNETTKPQAFCRVSVSVEQIQDRARVRGENIMFSSIFFPQTEQSALFPSPDLERVSGGRVRGQTNE